MIGLTVFHYVEALRLGRARFTRVLREMVGSGSPEYQQAGAEHIGPLQWLLVENVPGDWDAVADTLQQVGRLLRP